MDQILEDYKAYYHARMKRFEGNPMYENSYASEKAIYEAIAGCKELSEFKDRLGNLNTKNAVALIKDQAIARKENFLKMKEIIRAKGPAEILADINENPDNINDVIQFVNEVNQKNMVEISIDGFTDVFYSNFKLLEDLQVYKEADVPSKWKNKIQMSIKRDENAVIKSYQMNEENARQWKEGWTFVYKLIGEHRHYRKIPLPAESIKKRIEQTKRIRKE